MHRPSMPILGIGGRCNAGKMVTNRFPQQRIDKHGGL